MTTTANDMEAMADRASDLLGAMANQKRLMILCRLLDGEMSVNQLVERTGIRQSTMSQHLALLRRDQLVTSRSEGQTRLYSLSGHEARRVIETLYGLYCQSDPDAKGEQD